MFYIESVKDGVVTRMERNSFTTAKNIFNRKVLSGKFTRVDLLEINNGEITIVSSYINKREVR